MSYRLLQSLILAAGILFLCAKAPAIVKHPGYDGVPTSYPACVSGGNDVVGRWVNGTTTNGSAVVIGPNTVLTVRHSGGGPGSIVYIKGADGVAVPYTVGVEFDAPLPLNETLYPDLRVAQLWTADGRPANLTQWVSAWPTTNENAKSIVLGGFGKIRGSTSGNSYTWASNSSWALNWGANVIGGTYSGYYYWYENGKAAGSFKSDTLILDFDGIGSGAVAYEAAVAQYDSGGGWFTYSNNQWYVLALSAYVQHSGSSYFSTSTKDGDLNWGVRVSSYASWISGHDPQYLIPIGDATLDGKVDVSDLGILASNYGQTTGMTWQTGDFNRDGMVDVADLAMLATYYGTDMAAGGGSIPAAAVPEPASLLAISLGAAATMRKPRRK